MKTIEKVKHYVGKYFKNDPSEWDYYKQPATYILNYKNPLKADNAWITDEGLFIPLKWGSHDVVIEYLFKMELKQVENMGWIRICNTPGQGFRVDYVGRGKPNQSQIDTYFDWCNFRKSKYAWDLFSKNYL